MRWYREPGTLLALALLLCGTAAIFWFNTLREMKSSDWAAWVQAIGSIGAISAVVWQVGRQHKLAIRADERRAANQELDALTGVAELVKYARTELTALDAYIIDMEQSNSMARLQYKSRSFDLIAAAIQAIDPRAFAQVNIALAVRRILRSFDQVHSRIKNDLEMFTNTSNSRTEHAIEEHAVYVKARDVLLGLDVEAIDVRIGVLTERIARLDVG